MYNFSHFFFVEKVSLIWNKIRAIIPYVRHELWSLLRNIKKIYIYRKLKLKLGSRLIVMTGSQILCIGAKGIIAKIHSKWQRFLWILHNGAYDCKSQILDCIMNSTGWQYVPWESLLLVVTPSALVSAWCLLDCGWRSFPFSALHWIWNENSVTIFRIKMFP